MSAPYGEYMVAQLLLDTGVTSREYTYQLPYGVKISRSYCAADAASGTDSATPLVTVAGTTIKTGTIVDTADIIREDIGVDVGQSDFIPANTPFKLTFTYVGTAANVRGLNFRLFGSVKR
jgi:hypothetical protein